MRSRIGNTKLILRNHGISVAQITNNVLSMYLILRVHILEFNKHAQITLRMSFHISWFPTKMADSIDEEVTEATDLVKKKNAKSIVWNYFGLKADGNGIALKEHKNRPVCRTYNKSVLCKGGNTSNLSPTYKIITQHSLKKQAKQRELHPPFLAIPHGFDQYSDTKAPRKSSGFY